MSFYLLEKLYTKTSTNLTNKKFIRVKFGLF